MTTLTFAELDTWLNQTPEHRQRLLDIGIVPDDEDHITAADFTYYLSEATSSLTVFMQEQGLILDEDTHTLAFNVSQFPAIRQVCDAIHEEYDSQGPSPTWDEFGLSGDDDVDYNGGYLTLAMDILELYEEMHTC